MFTEYYKSVKAGIQYYRKKVDTVIRRINFFFYRDKKIA
jgi:hypothetical protein